MKRLIGDRLTETEQGGQWAVRLTRRDGVQQYTTYATEKAARDNHSVNQQWFAEEDPAWIALWQRSELVYRPVGAWQVITP